MSKNGAADQHENLSAFQASYGQEVLAKAHRVRHLLGGIHWPSDGAYKERLIRGAIRDITPSRLQVGQGFMVCADAKDIGLAEPVRASNQLDILVYSAEKYAPLFTDDDFACVVPGVVAAVGEVKSTLDKSILRQALGPLTKAALLFRRDPWYDHRPFATVVVGMEGNVHTTGDGLSMKGMRAYASVFADAYGRIFPSGICEQHRDPTLVPAQMGFPTAACALSGSAPWVATGHAVAPSGGTNSASVRIPAIQFWNPWLEIDGERHNMALHIALSALRYQYDPLPLRQGEATPEDTREVNRFDWKQHFKAQGKYFALIKPNEELRKAYAGRVEWILD